MSDPRPDGQTQATTEAALPSAALADTAMSAGEVRGRSMRGVAAVAVRGLGVRLAGLATSVVLARLLVPADFGVLAFGSTLILVGGFLTDAGLAAQLVRGSTAPTRRELSAVLGFQLGVTLLIVGVASAVLVRLGTEGAVTALMLWALVPATFRVPASVQLERDLRFTAVAVAEVLETVVYAVLAVGLVVLGAGVWGVAAATVLRSFVGAAVVQRAAPQRILRPRLDRAAVTPLLAFGLTFQLGSVLALVRDQGVNLLTVGIGSTVVLGYWSVAQRVMLVPFLLFESLWRVSYPAVARLLEAGHDVRDDLSRSLVLGSFLTGLVVVPLAVSASVLVPTVFGDQWDSIIPVIPLACAGLAISGPVSAVGAGFLSAVGRVRLVALGQGATMVPWAVLLPLLLPRIGVVAHGVAWAAACVVDAAVLAWALQRHAGIAVARSALPAALGAIAVGAAALGVAAATDGGTIVVLVLVVGSTALYVALAPVLAPGALQDARRVARQLPLRRKRTAGS